MTKKNKISNSLSFNISKNRRNSCPEKEIYNICLNAQISTLNKGSKTIDQILGHEFSSLLISPSGQIAEPIYLETQYKDIYYSDEDNKKRCCLMNSQEFRERLSEAGWMIFSKVEQFNDYDHKKIGGMKKNYKRTFKLSDFIKILKIINKSQEKDYSQAISDLSELTFLGDELTFAFSGLEYHPYDFFHLPIIYKDRQLGLNLRGIDSILEPESHKHTLTREVSLDFNFPFYSGIPSEINKSLVVDLIKEYIKKHNLHVPEISTDITNGKMRLLLANKNYLESIPNPDTPAFLDRALNLKEFADSVIAEEHISIRLGYNDLLSKRKIKYGLD
ncbi:MAG TPA: hypothetical protein P5277_01405 [Candidatus Paceibacterota bacterium]|nr:hypothetical protein [Candidatus Paceibacterota bacterium]